VTASGLFERIIYTSIERLARSDDMTTLDGLG